MKDVYGLNNVLENIQTAFKASKVFIELDENRFKNLEILASKNNVSSYSIFLATLYILLYKYTSKSNLIIGTPFSEKISEEFQNIARTFSSDIILSQKINPNLNFIDFVRSVNKDIIDTFSNRLSPFESLKDKLSLKENSLFDTLLIYQTSEPKTFNIGDSDIRILNEESSFPKPNLLFEIDFKLHTLNLEFNKNVIKIDTAKSILAHYLYILKQVYNSTSSKINDLDMLTPEENRLLEKFNQKIVKIDNFVPLSIFDTSDKNTKFYILDKDMKNVPIGSLGEIYVFGKIKENAKYESESLIDNPFGEGKIYKSNIFGMWTFDGKIEIIEETSKKDVPSKEASAETTAKPSKISLSETYSFLKKYDYTKVNSVLSRNTSDNFKTISKTEPRRYFTYRTELDI